MNVPRCLQLVIRHDCELCSELSVLLQPYEQAGAVVIEALDVDGDVALHMKHAFRVPVLFEGETELLWGRIDPAEVLAVLGPVPAARE